MAERVTEKTMARLRYLRMKVAQHSKCSDMANAQIWKMLSDEFDALLRDQSDNLLDTIDRQQAEIAELKKELNELKEKI